MAPLIRSTIQLLLSSIGIERLSLDTGERTPVCQQTQSHGLDQPIAIGASLSTVSWGYNRMDVFGKHDETGALIHKYWDGYQWKPSIEDLEGLGEIRESGPPGAIAGNGSKMDIFTVSHYGTLQHKYFDGKAWKPSTIDIDELSDDRVLDQTFAPSATSWESGRLDIFSRGQDSTLWHKYFDGSSWGPGEMDLEHLGGDLRTGPAAVSWGTNRNDVFAVQTNKNMGHMYWDGSSWSDWHDVGTGFSFYETPTVLSWAENRLDVFAVDDDHDLAHIYWDGSQWKEENLGGGQLTGTVAAVSWAVDRFDIVALGQDSGYYHKYYDGSSWSDWIAKGGNFSSVPSVVSWGQNRLDIWGINDETQLVHQLWDGYGWYPGPDQWEVLGDEVQAFNPGK